MKTYKKLRFIAYSIEHQKQRRFEAVYEVDDFMGMKAYRLVHGSLRIMED